jgi:hypothetical protein
VPDKIQLWRVSNGWIHVPEHTGSFLSALDAKKCTVFDSLEAFVARESHSEKGVILPLLANQKSRNNAQKTNSKSKPK